MMTATPHQTSSSSSVFEECEGLCCKDICTRAAVVSMGETLQPRQKKSKADPSTGGGKKTPEFVIRLPRPANGSIVYPPQEAITHIQNALRDVERLSGTTNRNVQRSS